MDSDILNLSQVAATLAMDEDKVRALLEAGELPGRQIGDQWYVTRRKLVAFIEGEEEQPSPTPPSKSPPDANVFPLNNAWRCGRCDHLNTPERVECAQCGRARSVPLINFRLGS